MAKIRLGRARLGLLLGFVFLLVLAGIGLRQWPAGDEPSLTNTQPPAVDLGIMEEMNFVLSIDEVGTRQQQALRGDNDAANALANHYREIGRPAEERRWAMLAANRGDCAAMASLNDAATLSGDARDAARWNDMMRQNRCTWGKTFPETSDSNPGLESLPLWNEQ